MRYEVELTYEQARAVSEQVLSWVPESPVGAAFIAFTNAIRANPPKPPRMDEPGPWGVVLATRNDWRGAWVRDGSGPWVQTQTGARVAWHLLEDPQLVREGLS